MANQQIRPARGEPLFDELLLAGSTIYGIGDPNTIGPGGGPLDGQKFNTFLDVPNGDFYQLVSVSPNVWSLQYSVPGGGGGAGDITNADNVGTGTGEFFESKLGTFLNFRTLFTNSPPLSIETTGPNVNLFFDPVEVDINELGGAEPLSVQNGGTGIQDLFENYTMRGQGAGQSEVIVVNNQYSATSDPLPSDDSAQGYRVGSMWYNTTDNKIFTCVNPVNPAIWQESSDKVNNFNGSVNPGSSNDETEGYSKGSIWFNATWDVVWICNFAGAGFASWLLLSSPQSISDNAPPTATDDIDQGYTVSSSWTNLSNNDIYLCTDSSPGAAVWKKIEDGDHPVVESIYRQQVIQAHTIASGLLVDQWTGWGIDFTTTPLTNTNDIIQHTSSTFSGFRYTGSESKVFRFDYNILMIFDKDVTPAADLFEFCLVKNVTGAFTPASGALPAGGLDGSQATYQVTQTGGISYFSVSGDAFVLLNQNDYLGLVVKSNQPFGVATITNNRGSMRLQGV